MGITWPLFLWINDDAVEIFPRIHLHVAATNYLKVAAELLVNVDKNQLPKGWKVLLLPQPKPKYDIVLSSIARKAKLLGVEGLLLEPGQSIVVPIGVEAPEYAKKGTSIDVKVHGALVPLIAGKRKAVGNGFTYKIIAQ